MIGWIGVDLDGTLAKYDKWVDVTHVGEPIMPMVDLVKKWLNEGTTVKIVTARVNSNQPRDKIDRARYWIQVWCLQVFGKELEVTSEKDYGMIELYDDRARQVEFNTGRIITDSKNE